MKVMWILLLVTTTAFAQNKPKYTDAQIVQLMSTINTSEMKLAEYAEKASADEQIDSFASKMLKDHAANRQKLTDYAKTNKLVLATSAKNEDLKMRGNAKLDQLKELKGKLFDKAYIDIQVSDHKDVIAELDGVLIPSTQNENLEAMLRQTRDTVQAHLQHAESLQASFK